MYFFYRSTSRQESQRFIIWDSLLSGCLSAGTLGWAGSYSPGTYIFVWAGNWTRWLLPRQVFEGMNSQWTTAASCSTRHMVSSDTSAQENYCYLSEAHAFLPAGAQACALQPQIAVLLDAEKTHESVCNCPMIYQLMTWIAQDHFSQACIFFPLLLKKSNQQHNAINCGWENSAALAKKLHFNFVISMFSKIKLWGTKF